MAGVLTAGRAMGAKLRGEALVATDGFSARYDLDRAAGVFSRPSHALYGTSYVGRVLVQGESGLIERWAQDCVLFSSLLGTESVRLH